MLIKAILFDFDGTLTEPGSLDFDEIRAAVGCSSGQPVLEYIQSLASPEAQQRARDILDRFEAEAACRSCPNAGAEDLLRFLRLRRLKIGIITRNSLASVRRSLENFTAIGLEDFDVVLSRDDSFLPKPSPEAVLEAARRLALSPAEILLVGDYIFDVEAGYQAGTRTALITNGRPAYACEHPPDYTIHQLSDLKPIINDIAALPEGKLPNELLQEYLSGVSLDDPSLLVAPGVGEDVAAVRLEGGEILLLKSDPVTFASDRIGHYAVTVNANDIATAGGKPRWLLATMLFPPGTGARQIRETMAEVDEVARRHRLTLCGGHTEITGAVNRTVIAAQVAGTVEAGRLIEKRNMKAGDSVLLTKGIAVEGTCIIAREFPSVLRELGVPAASIEKCQKLLVDPGISIVEEASIAVDSGQVTAMHDVTEGGLATALEELSSAGNHRIRVLRDSIPVLGETAGMCRLLGVDPLGLIGSGSLLIVCRQKASEDLIRRIRAAGIEAARIGEILDSGTGIEAVDRAGSPIDWPHFEVDEIARLFTLRKA